jgi:hypothetical protein
LQATGAVLAYAGLSALARRWHRKWGATPKEAVESLPGDQLVPTPDLQTTRAITIAAPAADVWPWLVQMGQGRAGLYTYEWVENLLGAQIHNLDRIDPDLQRLEPGDHIRLTPDVYLGRIPGQFYAVQEIHSERELLLLQELPTGGLTSWSFILRPITAHPDTADRTRALIRVGAPGRTGSPSGRAAAARAG